MFHCPAEFWTQESPKSAILAVPGFQAIHCHKKQDKVGKFYQTWRSYVILYLYVCVVATSQTSNQGVLNATMSHMMSTCSPLFHVHCRHVGQWQVSWQGLGEISATAANNINSPESQLFQGVMAAMGRPWVWKTYHCRVPFLSSRMLGPLMSRWKAWGFEDGDHLPANSRDFPTKSLVRGWIIRVKTFPLDVS